MNLVVTCAIIVEGSRVLAAQRSKTMTHPLEWEFPGGKVEPGETTEDCIVREIMEELGLKVMVVEAAPGVIHPHSSGRMLELLPFVCRVVGGKLRLREHAQVRWCLPDELGGLAWARADVEVLVWWRENEDRHLSQVGNPSNDNHM